MSSIWNISFGAKYFEVFVQGGTILGGSNFVFRVRFLYGFMFVYICQDDGAVGFVDFTTLLFALYSLAQPFNRVRSIPEHVFVKLSLRRTFSRRNSRKRNRSNKKMAAPEASVHPVRNRLWYHFSLYQTNKSCSQGVSRRLMLLISFNKSYLRVTAPNVTEAERPFYDRSQRWFLHVIRRLLLQLLASVLSSHVRF